MGWFTNSHQHQQYLRELDTRSEALESVKELSSADEQWLRDLLQDPYLHDTIDFFLDKKVFSITSEIYRRLFSLCNLASVKSKNEKFKKWAKKQASLFEEKVSIEKSSMKLRLDAISIEAAAPLPPEEFERYNRQLRIEETIAPIERYRPIEKILGEIPLEDLPNAVLSEFAEIEGRRKTELLSRVIESFLRRNEVSSAKDYNIVIKIGPSRSIEFSVDHAMFDESQNLTAIVEVVNRLTMKDAHSLALRNLKILEEYPALSVYVLYIRGKEAAVGFMEPLVKGIYSVNDIDNFLTALLREYGLDGDISSHEIDIDTIIRGKPKSLQDKLMAILEVLIEMEKEMGAVKKSDLIDRVHNEFDIQRVEATRLVSLIQKSTP